MKKTQIIIPLIFCISAFSFAENSFRIQNITTREGLSQNTIRCLKQDTRGFIWIGTLNGLDRYDGTEFVVMLPKYGTSTSLSDNRIKSIHEDKYGYMWVQTNIDNINCYDTRLERFIPYHSFSINHTDILISNTGDVWLWGSNSGCLRIIHKENNLITNHFGKDKLGSDVVNFVFEGSDKTFWIGTNNKLFSYNNNKLITRAQNADFHSAVETKEGICFFTNSNKIIILDKETKKPKKELKIHIGDERSKLNNVTLLSTNIILITSKAETYIFDLKSMEVMLANTFFDGKILRNAFTYFDNRNNLWIYNKTGSIWQYNKNSNTFNEIKLIPPSILSFIDLERYSIYHDSRNIIWITTYGNGLFALNQNTGETIHIKHEKNQTSGLRTNFLLSIIEDSSGEIWVGTEYAGISKLSLIINKNKIFFPEGEESNDGDKIIRLIHEDEQENIWLGTKNGNLYIYDKDQNKLVKHVIAGGMPYALAEDTARNKWVGTKGKGLLVFKQNIFDKFQVYTTSPNDATSISNNNIYAVSKDSKGRMWLGTFGSGLLLAERKKENLTFRKFPELRKQQNRIRSIMQDKSGLIWIGGNSGVTVFNPDELIMNDSLFTSFHFDSKNAKSISNNEVKVIYEDSEGRIWLGTSGGGINLVMREGKIENTWFKHFTSEDGLINNIVQGIQEDDNGNLWISTESGISKFDIKSSRFENYNFSDNWEGDLFCESASFKRKKGDILFGSYNGMYIIKPDSMTIKDNSPNVLITSLKINGNKVYPGDPGSPLSKAISLTKRIVLQYHQNSFNLQFASLDFRNPAANSFTYILEGYEKTWNPVTRHHVATYRNIPAGTYIFRVKGGNSLGIWNQNETTLEIKVIPPLWRSAQAILVYMAILILIGFIAIRTIFKINDLNTAVKIEQQLTEYKLHFFTNISHEFRTPLTIIRGTIENLLSQKNIPSDAAKQIGFLEKSSSRLLRLINQLLEFRRLQNDRMELTLEQTEIVAFFKDIFSTFEEPATRKNIAFNFKSNQPSWDMPIDQSMMDKVAYNLLSNAFKFTPENGIIDLKLKIDLQNDRLSFIVSDNGIGVPKEKQSLLFVRFKQINPSSTGTGIGLHLTSELVKAHQGEIKYEESVSGGASFIVNIPLSSKAYENKVKIVDEDNIILERESLNIPERDVFKQRNLQALKKNKLLIIEDDPEISEFLNEQLSEYFQVTTAKNGLIGLEKCIGNQPDLIICDAMMPEMNGFEVTQRLKSEFSTCHIPVIMLTAYASIEHQLLGIEAGADSYITKPFSIRYLLTRIIKLIEQREKLQQKFVKEPGLIQMPVYTVDKDNIFMKKIHEIIEENIENAEFSIETFAASVGMGRTAFFKKIKGLTGFTPNEYMRVLRMKKAAELLTSTTLNVSEVAYKTGINNPFYFSKCFKEQFGVTPSEFSKKGTAGL